MQTLAPFEARRRAFAAGLGEAAALIPSGQERRGPRASALPFRPTSDFYYLTGFEEPDAALLLLPGHPTHRAIAFVRPRDPLAETWNGRRLGVDAAPAAWGVDLAYPIEELPQRLPALLAGCRTLCYPLGEHPDLDAHVLPLLAGTSRHTLAAVQHPKALLHPMRQRKDAGEIAVMRRAAAATQAGFEAAVAAIRPGAGEWEVRGALEGTFMRQGASAPAYGTIVAGGENATILHYTDNRQRLEAGQLVLVDAGAELGCYASDVTRTYPVSGEFTPMQRAVYDIVLAAQEAAIQALRAGEPAARYHRVSDEVLAAGLVQLGVLSGDPASLVEAGAHRPYTLHRAGHFLGLDTHDPGDWERLLEPDMVLTVEPGLYFPSDMPGIDPALWGLGVRIEDDVRVTEGAPEVLTAGIPKRPDAVEALMTERIATA